MACFSWTSSAKGIVSLANDITGGSALTGMPSGETAFQGTTAAGV